MPAPLLALAGGLAKGGLVKGAMVKGATAKAVGTKALVKTTTVNSGVMRGGGAIVRSGGGASGKLVKSRKC